MAATADEIVDRRSLRRKLTFWRVASILLVALSVMALVAASGAFDRFSKTARDHIARVKIEGMITNDRDLLDLLDDLADKEHVKAVLLDISSPGGTTVGGEAIYEKILEIRKEKPVVTSVGTLAASAGYMIAAASDHIVARRSSIVGSIGVIFQSPNFAGLMDKLGVKVEEIKSAPLKAEPSPFSPTSDEARQMVKRLIDDTFSWFVGIVRERRGMSEGQARALSDGSIFTGSQGLANGLVDAIGDEETAREWLVSEKGIDKSLEIVTWTPKQDTAALLQNPAGLAGQAIGWIAKRFGLDFPGGGEAIRELLPERLFLDGLISMLQIEDHQSRGGAAE